MARHHLSSAGSLGSVPRLHVTMRRSDSPSPVPPHFVAFARPVSRSHRDFAHMAAGCVGHGPGVGDPASRPGATEKVRGLPGSWVPRYGRAPLSDPGGIAGARPSRRRGAAFLHEHDVGSREYDDFGAQSHGPSTGCLRFAGRVGPSPRQTRFRLLAKLCRAGVGSGAPDTPTRIRRQYPLLWEPRHGPP
jgi:hypothetical protein